MPSAFAEWHSGSHVWSPLSQLLASNLRVPQAHYGFFILTPILQPSHGPQHPLSGAQTSEFSAHPVHRAKAKGTFPGSLFWAPPVSISIHQPHPRLGRNLPKGWVVLRYYQSSPDHVQGSRSFIWNLRAFSWLFGCFWKCWPFYSPQNSPLTEVTGFSFSSSLVSYLSLSHPYLIGHL